MEREIRAKRRQRESREAKARTYKLAPLSMMLQVLFKTLDIFYNDTPFSSMCLTVNKLLMSS